MNAYNPLAPDAFAEQPLSPLVRLGPIDDLESALAESWLDVSQATYRFLTLLREFDLRRGWEAYGFNDCAEWMDLKLKMSRKTALEKVRVAKALWFLPKVEAAFEKGQLSYSQVRALTRVADEDNEAELLEYALGTTACQLERYCQRLRHGDKDYAALDARRQHQGRALHMVLDEGSLTVKLPPAELALVQQALEKVVSELPEDPQRDYFAARADALVQMAQQILAGDIGSDSADSHQVIVHVDASALDGQGGEADVPLPTVKRLCCDGGVVPVIRRNGEVLDVGRKQRIVPTAMKRALLARDRSCRFPGCHHTQFLDAHHIEHWSEGGETSLDNLVVLCSHHHRLLHEQGFQMRKLNGGYTFARPDGRLIESSTEDLLSEEGAASSAEDVASIKDERSTTASSPAAVYCSTR